MQMRRFIGRAVLAVAVAAGSAAAAASGEAVFGFSASQGAAELTVEQRFETQ